MSKAHLAGGMSPFAHLLNGMLGRKPSAARAEEDGLDPEDEGEIDQDEVDDALDDADVEDVEDGAKKGKRAKGKGAKAEDEDDAADADDAEAEEPEDEKEAKAFRRGLAAGARRENKRCAAIFGAPAAGTRPDVAAQLAFGTRQSAAEAIGVLNTAAAGTGRSSLADRMSGRSDPRPGNDGGQPSGKATLADRMAAAKKKAGIA